MRSRLSVIGGLFAFMLQGSRKYWLFPLFVALLFVMVLAVVAAVSPVVAPFIYPFF